MTQAVGLGRSGRPFGAEQVHPVLPRCPAKDVGHTQPLGRGPQPALSPAGADRMKVISAPLRILEFIICGSPEEQLETATRGEA